jgi:Spy/CpxP family protein refolding chaperone
MIGASLLDNAALKRSWDPRLVCGVALALVFLSGAAAGAIVMDLRVHDRLRPPVLDAPAGKAAYFERMRKELDLTPAQSDQMESILTDFWQYYRTVMTDSKLQVEQLLTEEQRQKFNRLLQQQLTR